MKTTLMTSPVDVLDALGTVAVAAPVAAVRERRIAPPAAWMHGTALSVTALSVTAQGAAFGAALPGSPRGAPV